MEKLSQLVDEKSDTFIDSRRLSTLGFHRRKLFRFSSASPSPDSNLSFLLLLFTDPRKEEGEMVAIPLNAFTCHGSGLASLSRNLIKTFNIREIPDVDGTPLPSIRFDSTRFRDTFARYVFINVYLRS